MKNPMTPQQQCQAVMDNAAGYDMQTRPITATGTWYDRSKANAGEPLDFQRFEYRRKPEPIMRFANVYKDGIRVLHKTLADAIHNRADSYIRTIRVIEDPGWVEPEPAMPAPEDKNPRQPTEKDALQRAVDWWLENGMQKFIGAPAWVFDARALLEPESCKVNTVLSRVCEHGTKSCEVVHDKPSTPMNPWRPIIEGEWPECDPRKRITLRWEGGSHTADYTAGKIDWHCTEATHWRYAEDE